MVSRAEREQQRYQARVQRALYWDRWDQLIRELTVDRRELQKTAEPDPETLRRYHANVRLLVDVVQQIGVRAFLLGPAPARHNFRVRGRFA